MAEDSILVAIGRLEGKVDSLISSLKMHSDTLAEHDSRLRSLEQGKAVLLGAAAVLGGGSGFLVKILGG